MEITIHDVPASLREALLARAGAENKSVDEVTLEAIARGIGVEIVSQDRPTKRRDLSFLVGSWQPDPEFDAILEEQRRIDPELWQ